MRREDDHIEEGHWTLSLKVNGRKGGKKYGWSFFRRRHDGCYEQGRDVLS